MWHQNMLRNQVWVIYTDSSFKDKKRIEGYPNIKKHLDQFRKVITSDNKPYGLHRARDEYFFKGEKIVAVRKCARPADDDYLENSAQKAKVREYEKQIDHLVYEL